MSKTYYCEVLKYVRIEHTENHQAYIMNNPKFTFNWNKDELKFSEDFVVSNYSMHNIMKSSYRFLYATDSKNYWTSSLIFSEPDFRWSYLGDALFEIVRAKCLR